MMILKPLLIMACFCFGLILPAQNSVKIYGVISDSQTGETLPSATLSNKSNLQGTVSNVYGYYILNVTTNELVILEASYIGYTPQTILLKATKDTILNFKLNAGIQLNEYTISGFDPIISSKHQIGQQNLSGLSLKYAPSIAGESNVMMVLKTLPGVSAGKEGSSELYVRGGSHDQNLILLDKSPVYNLNHAFGLLSVFNSSAIKNVSLYKGGIPSEFGGRLSSVLDVSVKEGNRKSYNGDFTVSTIAATVSAEGPIIKDKSSFLFSARRSWPDLFVTGIASELNNDLIPGYYFMDINAKVNYTLKEKHHFFASFYTGQDKLFAKSNTASQSSEINQGWGNTIASTRYQSVADNGAFNDATLYYSSFREFDLFGINSSETSFSQKNISELQELGFKTSRLWSNSSYFKHKLGVDGLLRSIITPYKVTEGNGSSITSKYANDEFQKEMSVYALSQYEKNKVELQFGLRASMFGEKLTSHFSLEPRLSAFYHFNSDFSFKMGAMRNSQALFAMPKSVKGLPGYTWLPTTKQLQPQSSWQISAGINKQLGRINFDAEVYYKWMKNIAGNYLYPSSLYQSIQWYDIIDQGRGRAYGLDLLAQYFSRDVQLNFKYSLSKTSHSFPTVLNGNWIPANYDIRHDIALTGTWTVKEKEQSKKWFTGTFAMHTGIPISLPTQSIKSMMPIFNEESYFFDFSYLDYFNQPNNSRLKMYHRLDIGFHMQKTKPKGFRTWSVGLINLYNQPNPYSIYRDDQGDFKKLVLFPLMPFVSFNRKF